MIVLEGPDGAGKTTLAHQLCERYDWVYHHEGPPPTDVSALEHYGSTVERYRWMIANKEIKGVVFDRLALGERVYGPLFRKKDRLGEPGWLLIKRLLESAGAIHVLCLPGIEVCLKNWKERKGEMFTSENALWGVWERYLELSSEFSIVYDYTNPVSFHPILERVPQALPPGIWGGPAARFLFVGDQGSNPQSLTTDLAFFGTTDSSLYLANTLRAAGYQEHQMAFVNAKRWDKRDIEWPFFEKVVALGREAGIECARRDIDFCAVPHPQFWKRFHANERDRYVEMLRNVRENR